MDKLKADSSETVLLNNGSIKYTALLHYNTLQ